MTKDQIRSLIEKIQKESHKHEVLKNIYAVKAIKSKRKEDMELASQYVAIDQDRQEFCSQVINLIWAWFEENKNV